jgi:hypothetical protein
MPDAWILVFLARGLIAAAGDNMPLDQCMQRASDMPASNTHIACINVQDPSCRVHLADTSLTAETTARCLKRAAQVAKQGVPDGQ